MDRVCTHTRTLSRLAAAVWVTLSQSVAALTRDYKILLTA